MDIIDLFARLHRICWNWSMSEIEAIMTCLAGEPKKRKPDHNTYYLNDVEDVSLYFESDQAERLEITIESFRKPHLLSRIEYEDKVDEYFNKYQCAVDGISSLLGKPLFDDGFAAVGFPDDQEAVWLALWAGHNARLMIQQKHEDKELPFRLCIVVAPKQSPS